MSSSLYSTRIYLIFCHAKYVRSLQRLDPILLFYVLIYAQILHEYLEVYDPDDAVNISDTTWKDIFEQAAKNEDHTKLAAFLCRIGEVYEKGRKLLIF